MILVAASALPIVVLFLYRHPLFILFMFPILISLNSILVFDLNEVGGYFLVPTDAIYFFTILYLGICALRKPKTVIAAFRENVFLTLFLAVVGVYIVMYIPVYGHSALGEARKLYSMFLIPLLAAVVVRTPKHVRRFLQIIVWSAASVAVIGFGTAVARGDIFRPINAESALMLALTAILMLVQRLNRVVLISPRMDKFLLCLFFAGAATAGHRTVWLALGVGLLLTFWLYGRKQAFLPKLLLFVFLMLGAMGAGIALFPGAGARLGNAFQGILNPQADDTASWRIEGWQDHLDRLTRDGNLLLGEGFGTYYGQDKHGVRRPFPHSAYVELILKLGFCGVVFYLLFALKFLRNAVAVRKRLPSGPLKAWLEASILIFAAAHAYSSGYSFDPIMLMFVAIGVSVHKLAEQSLEPEAVENETFLRARTSLAAFSLQSSVRPRA